MGRKRYQSPEQRARAFRAFDRGILPVRRPLAEESVGVVEALIAKIVPKLGVSGEIKETRELGVSVVAFSRFGHPRHYWDGPPTSEVARSVEGCDEAVEATLGRLMLVGWGEYRSLAAKLKAPDLVIEEADFDQAFEEHGFPLRRTGEPPRHKYAPHLSLIDFEGDVGELRATTTLKRLSNLGEAIGKTVLFEPSPVCCEQPVAAVS